MGERGMEWDRRVLARLCAGDNRALAELYDAHAVRVHTVALHATGDAAAAADVTQEVFVAVWQRPDAIDLDRGTIAAYLTVMARRRAVDHVRQAGRRERRHERAAAARPVSPADAVEEAVVAGALCARVRAAVGRLPGPQREAVELAYFGGLSYTEVARRLGIPEGTAKSRLRLALAKLADVLREEGTMTWA